MWKEMPSKYGRKSREIQVIAAVKWSCKREVTQVANARWPKTASCRATNEGKWVTPTSEACPHVQFSKKHQHLVIFIEFFWVMRFQSFFPSSWGVRFPDPHRTLGRGTWLGKTNLSHDGLNPAHVPYWRVNNPTLSEFCFWMIGRATIKGLKRYVTMNAWQPQASGKQWINNW